MKQLIKFRHLLYISISICLLFASCSNNTNPDIDESAPEINGIEKIAENGTMLGKLGSPNSINSSLYPNVKDALLGIPMPNPVIYYLNVLFNTNSEKVTFYISPSRSILKSKYGDGVTNNFGYGASKIFGVVTLDSLKADSQYSYVYEFKEDNDFFKNWPKGYYRFYMKTNYNLYWQDIFYNGY